DHRERHRGGGPWAERRQLRLQRLVTRLVVGRQLAGGHVLVAADLLAGQRGDLRLQRRALLGGEAEGGLDVGVEAAQAALSLLLTPGGDEPVHLVADGFRLPLPLGEAGRGADGQLARQDRGEERLEAEVLLLADRV